MSPKPEPRIGPRHLIAPAIAYVVCAGVVLFLGGLERGMEAFAVALGPYAGGFARDWQSCCAKFSFQIAPYALGSVAVGIGSLEKSLRSAPKVR